MCRRRALLQLQSPPLLSPRLLSPPFRSPRFPRLSPPRRLRRGQLRPPRRPPGPSHPIRRGPFNPARPAPINLRRIGATTGPRPPLSARNAPRRALRARPSTSARRASMIAVRGRRAMIAPRRRAAMIVRKALRRGLRAALSGIPQTPRVLRRRPAPVVPAVRAAPPVRGPPLRPPRRRSSAPPARRRVRAARSWIAAPMTMIAAAMLARVRRSAEPRVRRCAAKAV